MFYEYPEEFIIPVTYADDLKKQSNYVQKDFESMRDWNLLIFGEELGENEIFQENKNLQGNMITEYPDEFKYMNFEINDEELLSKTYPKTMFNYHEDEESLEDKNIKNILTYIDEEYVNSETKKYEKH